ncbi:MAG: sodium-dependent bicarbonate transport family permease [Gemmatimonadetes bacterium]|nr:sodium-dependent bicarbonate transport family permease [Gemmatimonadota bacterium]
MNTVDLLQANLLSPIALAFALGLLARVVRSEFSLPKDVYLGLSIFLLWALGLQGGVELRHSSLQAIAGPALATVGLGVLTPITTYLVVRRLGRFSTADSAAIAAHYGSVSAVTFIAASGFVKAQGQEAEGFMPTLLTLLESPGIAVALALGAYHAREGERPVREVMHEVLTGRTMVLLLGGLVVGFLIGDQHWATIGPFYDTTGAVFRGVLCLFMLEMGVTAGARLGDLRKVGGFLLGFGMLMPLAHGTLGAWIGQVAGLSVGGATVLGTMAASASYIAAPPAVRLTLPDANPTYYLTAALVITFPFNLLIGIPVYFRVATWLGGAP